MHIKGPNGIQLPLSTFLKSKPIKEKIPLNIKDNVIDTSSPVSPNQAPLIAKSFVSPPPNPVLLKINLKMMLNKVNPKAAVKNANKWSII